MRRCLELAKEAKKNGFTAVGSVLVCGNQIIAEGREGESVLPEIMSHAENVALAKAIEKRGNKDLSDCLLYTTVEPCFMCTYLIRQTQIKKVVYGTTTPAGGDSSQYKLLRTTKISNWQNSPEIISGVLEEECKSLLQ